MLPSLRLMAFLLCPLIVPLALGVVPSLPWLCVRLHGELSPLMMFTFLVVAFSFSLGEVPLTFILFILPLAFLVQLARGAELF